MSNNIENLLPNFARKVTPPLLAAASVEDGKQLDVALLITGTAMALDSIFTAVEKEGNGEGITKKECIDELIETLRNHINE